MLSDNGLGTEVGRYLKLTFRLVYGNRKNCSYCADYYKIDQKIYSRDGQGGKCNEDLS